MSFMMIFFKQIHRPLEHFVFGYSQPKEFKKALNFYEFSKFSNLFFETQELWLEVLTSVRRLGLNKYFRRKLILLLVISVMDKFKFLLANEYSS